MEDKYINLGVVSDPRSTEERSKDWKKLGGAMTIVWEEKDQSKWKSYPLRDQSSSLSCVAQSCAKALKTMGMDIMSAHPIYRSRVNFPEGGMYLQNAGSICKNIGTCLESLDVSQKIGEGDMNRPIDVDTPIKVAGYSILSNPKDIDAIAESIELYGHCIMLFHGNRNEWLRRVPVYDSNLGEDIGHCLCAIDYFMYEGKKCILIDDSAGLFSTINKDGERIITEDYLKARFDGAMYLIPQAINPAFKHFFFKVLRFGAKGEEVIALQKALVLEKLLQMPSGVPYGYFGKLTLNALKDFQKKYTLGVDGIAGANTNAKLNKLFNK